MKTTTAIILGGTIPHKFLIENLKNRGYRTVLIDYYDNPPAAKVADRHVIESTLDKEAVLKIAKKESADLVISGCVDQANVTACYVGEKLGLPIPYSYKTSLRVTDKVLMKEGLLNAGVNTAVHEVISEVEISSYKVENYPKVVKPSDTNGSKGVRKVHTDFELNTALREACNLSKSNKAIVENLNNGFEISGYYFIGNNEVSEIYLKRKKLPEKNGKESLQSFISFGPERMSEAVRIDLKKTVKKISNEFNLQNTPLLLQANIDGDHISVIEFAPRVGGGLAFREIELLTDFSFIDAVLDSYLGIPVAVQMNDNITEMISILHLYGKDGIFDHIQGLEGLFETGIIEEYYIYKMPGMKINSDDLSSRNRVMGIILKANTVDLLKIKIQQVAKRLKIITAENIDVFRSDLLRIV